MMPTQVWVVILKDRQGKPRGFEKTSGKFHMAAVDAHLEWQALDADYRHHFGVYECVIMLDTEYKAIQSV